MGKARRARTKYHISSVQGDFDVSPSESKFVLRKDPSSSNVLEKNIEIDDVQNNGDDSRKMQLQSDSTNNGIMDTSEAECDPSKIGHQPGDWKIVPQDDLFKNVDIVMDELQPFTQISDSKPTGISISKCIKRTIAESGTNVNLRKEDKRELRRNLFIKKIDAIHQQLHKKKPKKAKGISVSKKAMEEIPCDKVNLKLSESPKLMKHKSDGISKISKRKQKKASSLKAMKQEMLNNVECFKTIISDAKYKSDALGFISNAVERKLYSDL